MRFYLSLLKVVATLSLPATISGNVEPLNQLLADDVSRELKKGRFSCGASSSTVQCIKDRQLCDTSTGKALCICAEGWKGSRCNERTYEPPSSLPTKMPTFSRVGSTCTQRSDCAAENADCIEGQCQCNSGFTPRKRNCINVNECEDRAKNGCHRDALCMDTQGSYECSCNDGFTDFNPILPGRHCQQTNECKLGTHNCDEAAQVCVDRRPPEKWECVERTPAPTPKPTPRPTSPPIPATVAPVCFSGDATVVVKGKGKVPMRNLNIGDMVLVKEDEYEPIIASGHRDFHHHSNFISITTNSTSESALEISPDHIVFLHNQEIPMPSKMLKIGNVLAGSNNEPLMILKIHKTEKKGIFSPRTISGKIVVNGILCSNYAFPMNEVDSDGIYYVFHGFKVMTLHSFHHMRHSPLRLAILGISSRFSYLDNKSGQNIFLKLYRHLYSAKSDNSHFWVQAISHIAWYLLLFFASLCFMLELTIGFQSAFIIFALSLLWLTKKMKSSFTVKENNVKKP